MSKPDSRNNAAERLRLILKEAAKQPDAETTINVWAKVLGADLNDPNSALGAFTRLRSLVDLVEEQIRVGGSNNEEVRAQQQQPRDVERTNAVNRVFHSNGKLIFIPLH